MKKFFSVSYSPFILNIWLLFLRLGAGAFMLTHGLPKLERLLEGNAAGFPDPIGLGPTLSLVLTILAEVVCSVLIMIGLGTRLASLPLIFTMLVAVFVVHADDPFSRMEMGLLYLLIYFTLLVLGSGKYSVDRFISGSRGRN
jgi:putative oxidoreductase